MLSFTDQSVGFAHSNCFIDDGSRVSLCCQDDLSKKSANDLLEYNFVANSTGIVRRQCFDTVGYIDERLVYCQDWDFWIRASKVFKFVYLQEPTAILHWQSSNRGSENLSRVITGYRRFFSKHWSEYEKRKKLLSKNLFFIGSNLSLLGEKDLSQQYLLRAFIADPANVAAFTLLCWRALEDSLFFKKSGFLGIVHQHARKKIRNIAKII